jgi:arsenite methyltransferase
MDPRVDAAPSGVLDLPRQVRVTDPEGGPMAAEERADYGVDSPKMVVVLGALGGLFAVWGVVVTATQGVAPAVGPWVAALLCVAAAGYMIRSSRVVKPEIWARGLDGLELKGRERALDVGCGRGLVTVGLAERLPEGSVVGVDIWRSRDQTGNTRANAEENLRREGIADRVELVDASMEDLPFDGGEFDVVTASLSLHCLPLAKDRGRPGDAGDDAGDQARRPGGHPRRRQDLRVRGVAQRRGLGRGHPGSWVVPPLPPGALRHRPQASLSRADRVRPARAGSPPAPR